MPSARLTEQLLAFRDDRAASAAMWALSQSLQPCGWGISHADGVQWDTDVLSASRVLSGSAVVEASVLHRGNALYLTVAEGGGSGHGGYHLGKVDVRRELCDVMRLCYR